MVMNINSLEFGKSMSGASSLFRRLGEKGDHIQFKIAQNPVYTGKHFQQKETGWDITECVRVNNHEECDRCNEYFRIKALSKKAKASGNEEEHTKLENEARDYNASIQFYFPVLNRNTEDFDILQTTYGVRNQLNEHFESGVDVLEKEWILRNTGIKGAKKYSLSMVDSAEVAPLSESEVIAFEMAKKYWSARQAV